jgi:tryptophan halogenase
MKITIVGGGTAGWIAAYFIAKSQPKKHDITVIESSKLGIIGAGEGSTGSMIDLLNGSFFDYRVSIEEFLKETDGTIKMGIYHQNWTGDNKGYFAPIDGSPTWNSFDDLIFKYVLAKYGKNKMHFASNIGHSYEKKEFTDNALHFDGHKVGKFFRKQCELDGVSVIDDVVLDATLDDLGNIKNIILESDQIIESDLYIDCTGFAKILMNKLGVGWTSYKQYLPVDTAMPFIIEYEPDETPNPYTKATALSAGWMWEIPLSTRKGCGYVFDSKYISKEDAQTEIENYLGKKIKPIKFINFESGRGDVFWEKNVLSLGLSSVFLEPLEATSIHTTIVQLLFFVKENLCQEKEKTLTKTNRQSYNQKIQKLCDMTVDFVSFHYQGGRCDSPFWEHIKNHDVITPNAKIFKENSKNKIPGFLATSGMIGSPATALWNWISAGINIITSDQ